MNRRRKARSSPRRKPHPTPIRSCAMRRSWRLFCAKWRPVRSFVSIPKRRDSTFSTTGSWGFRSRYVLTRRGIFRSMNPIRPNMRPLSGRCSPDEKIAKIGQNIKFDLMVLARLGVGDSRPALRYDDPPLPARSRVASQHGCAGDALPQLPADFGSLRSSAREPGS